MNFRKASPPGCPVSQAFAPTSPTALDEVAVRLHVSSLLSALRQCCEGRAELPKELLSVAATADAADRMAGRSLGNIERFFGIMTDGSVAILQFQY